MVLFQPGQSNRNKRLQGRNVCQLKNVMPGSSKCVKVVPFHQKIYKRQKFRYLDDPGIIKLVLQHSWVQKFLSIPDRYFDGCRVWVGWTMNPSLLNHRLVGHPWCWHTYGQRGGVTSLDLKHDLNLSLPWHHARLLAWTLQTNGVTNGFKYSRRSAAGSARTKVTRCQMFKWVRLIRHVRCKGLSCKVLRSDFVSKLLLLLLLLSLFLSLFLSLLLLLLLLSLSLSLLLLWLSLFLSLLLSLSMSLSLPGFCTSPI